jgi:hypothetical protein
MNPKLANGVKIWKGNWNTTTLLFSQKELEIVHQERRGQVKTIVIEHFNGIFFHNSGPTNQSRFTNVALSFCFLLLFTPMNVKEKQTQLAINS